MANYVGIYWTRAVPWARFTETSKDPEVAANESKTIRYQRALTHHFIRTTNGAVLKGELVFTEKTPDRAHSDTFSDFANLAQQYPKDAIYLWTDFHSEIGWRHNQYLHKALENYNSEPLAPIPLIMDGHEGLFDPKKHFENWRKTTEDHTNASPEHRQKVLTFLENHPAKTWRAKAEALNAENLWTHGGKAWSEDNLRKFLNVLPKHAVGNKPSR